MKDPLCRTKVVVRHLPPAIPQPALMEQISARFEGRYNWFCFRPGKNSQKNQRHSQVYIDFKTPEDVLEFAEHFDGHVFVNEKGAQFKTIVEYAPSQRVPKQLTKTDGREGTIFKDPEYLEFLDLLAKPVENLPSAEMQLERREAERAGAPKESLIVTPLMEFVRQKRAAKSGSQRLSTNGKLSRRAGVASAGSSSSAPSKRSSEKRRVSTSVYVLRDSSTKNAAGKEKPTYLLVPRRDESQVLEKSILDSTEAETVEDETVLGTDGTTSRASGSIETGRRKVILLKGKVRDISHASAALSQQQRLTSPMRNSPGSTAFKQSQRREASGRMIRSILSNKEAQNNQSSAGVIQSEQQLQLMNSDRDKRLSRLTDIHSVLKDHLSGAPDIPDSELQKSLDDKDLHTSVTTSDKQDRRSRNKDRPDRGVWTLRRSEVLRPSDESLFLSSPTHLLSDSLEGMSISRQVTSGVSKHEFTVLDTEASHSSSFIGGKLLSMDAGTGNSRLGRGSNSQSAYDLPSSHGEMKIDVVGRSGEVKNLGIGRSSVSSIENGSHRHVGRRGPAHALKEDNLSEGKPSKRGGATGYGSHEKQVWVQKSASGS